MHVLVKQCVTGYYEMPTSVQLNFSDRCLTSHDYDGKEMMSVTSY